MKLIYVVLDAKEIDPSDIEMKERLGSGQFGVGLFIQFCVFMQFCDDFKFMIFGLSPCMS